ncbi:xanthine dehydrogenase family protein molybdopterin-binding subunit [Pragia fontium]|uniref:xanthine dehydrogenase family protein molybdopterin-binding subunit n=1 Tax=Pragia fontium TaxID=82985 RepID=UPI000F704B7B|nr:molybdopterin cofactor-binding domain-containing protein [Pragia fontium]VEJ56559.1 Membrane-bound aldehyde dehydrogenase [pyrroloquinoline-quinone] precursor [Pragia fontium]
MSMLEITRRRLLQAGGLLMVSVAMPMPFKALADDVAKGHGKEIPLDQVDSFIAISADGQVTVFCGHVDLGTGIRTSLAQIIADELYVPFEKITMILGDTLRTPDQGPTIASASIQVTAIPLRKAAAQVRQFLLKQAAVVFAQPVDKLVTQHGMIKIVDNPEREISYGDLVKGESFNLTLNNDIALKPTYEYQFIGKPIARVDIPAKVTGGLTFVHDFRLPNMLHGRVILPPYGGADSSAPLGDCLLEVDQSSIADLPGIVKVVVIKDFVAVVAEREEQAIQAARKLKVKWKEWAGLPNLEPDDLLATLKAHPKSPRMLKEDDGVDGAMGKLTKVVNADYVWPYHMHASIGPSCAVADVTADKVEVWSGTQNPHDLRNDIVTLLACDREKVNIHRMEASGCYGRNCADDVAGNAALLSREVGRPVRVQLMREQENAWEPKGTAQLIQIRGGLDAENNVGAYEFKTCYPSNGATLLPLILTGVVANTAVTQQMGDRTAVPQYEYPNMRVVSEDTAPIVRASWMRGVSALPNVFAHESWIDELAYLAQQDPIAYRLRYLKDPRAIALIEALKKQSNWVDGPSFNHKNSQDDIVTGRGFAYARYFHSKFPGYGAAWAAWVIDIEVNRKTGHIKPKKIFISHDCGQIVNPAGVRHQIHGNIIQSTSRVLKEFTTFDKSGVTSLDWGGYPILRFDELPEIDIHLIENQAEAPMGVGESASVPSAAAIANAVFDATGVRLRQVPFTPARVKQALDNAATAK